jgi:hypothetical protein
MEPTVAVYLCVIEFDVKQPGAFLHSAEYLILLRVFF